MQLEIKASI